MLRSLLAFQIFSNAVDGGKKKRYENKLKLLEHEAAQCTLRDEVFVHYRIQRFWNHLEVGLLMWQKTMVSLLKLQYTVLRFIVSMSKPPQRACILLVLYSDERERELTKQHETAYISECWNGFIICFWFWHCTLLLGDDKTITLMCSNGLIFRLCNLVVPQKLFKFLNVHKTWAPIVFKTIFGCFWKNYTFLDESEGIIIVGTTRFKWFFIFLKK